VDNLNWPFKLTFGGEVYTLFSRGYQNGAHYWSKAYLHSGGLGGIWLHDDMQNNGYACLISRVPSTIGGTSPQTSCLMYLRNWTATKEYLINKALVKLDNDYPDATGSSPFKHLKEVLGVSKSPNKQVEDPSAANQHKNSSGSANDPADGSVEDCGN
jgi:hypothetical protein